MPVEIILPVATERVKVRDIPALFATAIHPEAREDSLNPSMKPLIMWHATVDEYTKEVRNAVQRGWLEPRSPLTLLPVPQAIGDGLLNAFVTVENLKEYAARFQVGIQEVVPLEQADPAAKVEALPVTQVGEPPMRPGKNNRKAVEAWVAWQARDKVKDGDNVSDLAKRIYLIAERWGYQSERQKDGEKISVPSIIKMIPAGLTGGRAKKRA